MRNKKSGYILSILEILALIQAYKIWSAPFTIPVEGSFSRIVQISTEGISTLLLLLPLAALFFISKNKRWAYVLLAAFPLLCIFFGITAFPGVSYFYGDHHKLNSLLTAFTNAFVCAGAFWLFVSARSNFNKVTGSDTADSSGEQAS